MIQIDVFSNKMLKLFVNISGLKDQNRCIIGQFRQFLINSTYCQSILGKSGLILIDSVVTVQIKATIFLIKILFIYDLVQKISPS